MSNINQQRSSSNAQRKDGRSRFCHPDDLGMAEMVIVMMSDVAYQGMQEANMRRMFEHRWRALSYERRAPYMAMAASRAGAAKKAEASPQDGGAPQPSDPMPPSHNQASSKAKPSSR